MTPVRVSFAAGSIGDWTIESIRAVCGDTLTAAPRLARIEGATFQLPAGSVWTIDGVRSNDRYVTRDEKNRLAGRQADLDRPGSTCAALIPIRKTAAWWQLTQDERRAIFEERSRHIAIGMDYLPAVARRLYHCRDLGSDWDFLTWFEYSAAVESAFDELVGRLRETEEWHYVDREVDIRVSRRATPD
jgi:chlorite dismutase